MNLPGLEKLMQDFYEISNMDIAVVDLRNRILARRYPGNRFCSHIHKCEGCLAKCEASDDMHYEEVKESGETVIYTCPFGIYEAIAPIKEKDSVVAFLFLGMAIEEGEEHERYAYERALEVTSPSDVDNLNKVFSEIPRYPKKTLDAFASMLPVLAEYIENNNLVSDTTETLGMMIKRYVKNNLTEKITLSDIAWHLHCSTVTLTEHFKKEFGITIMEYVTSKRMQMAVRLLENSDTSIRETAEACGFSDIEYFSKSFKKYHGTSPSEWRKRMRK